MKLKIWQKVAVVIVCGGSVWGLSYAGSLYPSYALVTSSFCTGITALCGIITGYPPREE